MSKAKKIIVVAGMTGVGKSTIARELIHTLNGELIAGDSV